MSLKSVPAPVPTALQGFTRLGPSVYIHEPATTTTTSTTTARTASTTTTTTTTAAPSPSLIVLSTWLDAQPRHISKYTDAYRTQHPSARLLLITTSIRDVTLRASPAATHRRIQPALEVLQTHAAATGGGASGPMLLHAFSNGGALTAVALARAYVWRAGHPLPLRALVLDSAPGRGSYASMVRALSYSLPRGSRVGYWVAALLLRGFLLGLVAWGLVWRRPNVIQVVRDRLLNRRVWGPDVARLYVYSRADGLVSWEDVEENAEEAEGRGWVVRRELFEGSAHCAHVLADEKRYWGAIRAIWEGRGGD